MLGSQIDPLFTMLKFALLYPPAYQKVFKKTPSIIKFSTIEKTKTQPLFLSISGEFSQFLVVSLDALSPILKNGKEHIKLRSLATAHTYVSVSLRKGPYELH